MLALSSNREQRLRTVYQDSVHKRIHCPNVGCPVSMAEPPREGKQATEHLLQLAPKRERTKGSCEYGNNANAQLDTVEELNGQVGKRRALLQAVGAQ